MAIQDYIDRLVGLQGFYVIKLRFREDLSTLWIEVSRREKEYRCTCGRTYRSCYDSRLRSVRDLSFGPFGRVWIEFSQCRIRCATCGVRTEYLDWVEPRVGYTKRLAGAVALACREIRSIKAIAQQFRLHWSVVKQIDKKALQEDLPAVGDTQATLLAIDEFAVKRGQDYGTTVADSETGEVLYVGKGRDAEALDPFFEALGPGKCSRIQAIAMDAWRGYAKAKRKHCPDAATVYDPFHLLQIYAHKVIDRVRIDECRKASKDNKAIIRGTKYLLLKNRKNLLTDRDEPARLRDLLAINQRLNTVYILKEDLKRVWIYKRKAWAARWLDAWCQRALDSGIKPLIRFTRKLLYHKESILAHCDYPIHTSIVEGINNKIKVIKRIAFGFRDFDYFALKIRGAFLSIHTSA